MSTTGGLAYFSYSGGAVCTPELLGVQSLERDGARFEFLSPIRIGDPAWRSVPRFTASRFLQEYPGATGIIDIFALAAHPAINEDGIPGITLSNEHAPLDSLPRDTFPIVITHDNWRKFLPVAEGMLADLHGRIRLATGQWWVGRPSEHLTGNCHVTLDADANGVTLIPSPTCRQTRPFENTQRLSPTIWGSLFDDLAADRKVSTPHLLESDAVYFYAIKEFRISLITLATAFESARDLLSERLRISFKGTDILKHLSVNLESRAGRNLETENADLYEFLKRVWIARGNLAHGRNLLWGSAGVQFGDQPAEHFFQPAKRLLDWCDTVR